MSSRHRAVASGCSHVRADTSLPAPVLASSIIIAFTRTPSMPLAA